MQVSHAIFPPFLVILTCSHSFVSLSSLISLCLLYVYIITIYYIRCINNAAPSFPSNFKKALEEFDVNEDGLIDYSEFLELDRRYPLMLFPAFRLQDVMQRTSLGEKVWLKVMEKYQEVRRIEEYKAAHGGRAPPDSPVQAFLKTVLPCFFREKIHIAVGSAMEKRHRDDE